jgi:hypothetical protein
MDINDFNEISFILKNQIIDIFNVTKSLQRFDIKSIRKITFTKDGEIVKLHYTTNDGRWRKISF